MVRAYKDHLAERNIWLRSGAHLLTTGRVRTSHMMCSRKALVASEWYAGYCLPLGVSQGIGATLHKDAVVSSNIGIFAGAGRPDFDRDDIALIERAVAAVYVTDPGQIPQRPEAIMSKMYGLTPAQAGVAVLIVRGMSGPQAADKLEVSYNTLKTHLKRIFAKTGTRNQGALIRLIIAGGGRGECFRERPATGPPAAQTYLKPQKEMSEPRTSKVLFLHSWRASTRSPLVRYPTTGNLDTHGF
jgi:DNA-binding CsgD family transcriptional regulator